MARTKFFEMSWGGVRLWWASVETDDGRDLAVQPFASGNTADVKDHGDVPGKPVSVSLLFDDFTGETKSAGERLEDILLLKAKGEPQLFVHPIYGAYRAFLGRFRHKIDEHGVITADAEFIADEDVGEVFSVDAVGVSLDVAADDVDTRAAELSSQLDAVGLKSDLPAQASAAAQIIEQAETAREKLVQVSQMSDRLWDEVDEKRIAYDVATWPALKAYNVLGDSLRAAADRATGGDAGAFMEIRVDSPTTLLRLLADVYGAEEAMDRRTEVMDLNDLRTPGAIPAGTKIRLRAPAARR